MDLHLIDRLEHMGEPLVFPQRSDIVKPAYPVGTCSDCFKQTTYSNNLCEDCAEGYTKAFYKIAYEKLGIKVKGVKYETKI